jgi:lantibiotic biosynthesis protein
MKQLEALEKVAAALDKQVEHHQQTLRLSLMNGATGVAMFYFYYSLLAGKEHYRLLGEEMVNGIIGQLNDNDFLPLQTYHSFSTGLAGIAHGLSHLQAKGFIDFDFDKSFSSLDEFLTEQAVADYEKGISDFLHGPMGVYYYLLGQQSNRNVLPLLSRLNDAFLAASVQDEKGIRTRNMILEEVNEQEFDLGLAHGITGVMLILLRSLEQQCNVEQVEPLFEALLKYMLSAEKSMKETGGNSFFPTSVNEAIAAHSKENQDSYVVRLAWCYGDLNMAWLLVKAGKVLGRPALTEKGIAVGIDAAARREYHQHQVGDVFFCHGSSGVAYFFLRLYQETGEPVFQEAWQYWMDITLDAVLGAADGWADKLKPFSLLEGLAGLGLALLPAEVSGWNEIFLMK